MCVQRRIHSVLHMKTHMHAGMWQAQHVTSYVHKGAHTTHTVKSDHCIHTKMCLFPHVDTHRCLALTWYMTAKYWAGPPISPFPMFLKPGNHRALAPTSGPLLLPVHQQTLSLNWSLPRSGSSRRQPPVHTGQSLCLLSLFRPIPGFSPVPRAWPSLLHRSCLKVRQRMRASILHFYPSH